MCCNTLILWGKHFCWTLLGFKITVSNLCRKLTATFPSTDLLIFNCSRRPRLWYCILEYDVVEVYTLVKSVFIAGVSECTNCSSDARCVTHNNEPEICVCNHGYTGDGKTCQGRISLVAVILRSAPNLRHLRTPGRSFVIFVLYLPFHLFSSCSTFSFSTACYMHPLQLI